MVLKRFFARKESPAPPPAAIPAGKRVYAIGDIHGRADLLDQLLVKILADDAARDDAEAQIIFLGDLADRGPGSRQVIEHAMALAQSRPDTVFIMGNHEELLIRVWDGDRATAATFHRAGGRETLISYGITAEQYDSWDLGEVTDATTRVVPKAHIDFLRAFRSSYRLGDYFFTHAGVRPGIALDDQDETDLRWIRSDFIDSTADFGAVVVHGHTIRDAVEERANRIGIDTGAYASGRLTAIGLEGTDRWYLST